MAAANWVGVIHDTRTCFTIRTVAEELEAACWARTHRIPTCTAKAPFAVCTVAVDQVSAGMAAANPSAILAWIVTTLAATVWSERPRAAASPTNTGLLLVVALA